MIVWVILIGKKVGNVEVSLLHQVTIWDTLAIHDTGLKQVEKEGNFESEGFPPV